MAQKLQIGKTSLNLKFDKIQRTKTRWFFLYLCAMEKENQIVVIIAIIEAIQSGATVDKVYIQKEASGELMKDLMKVMKRIY